MNVKTCKQCGKLKPIEQYRKYYGGRKGTYTTCKLCEKINAREKYLRNKDSLSQVETEELNKIHKLYDAQRKAGLMPPREKQWPSTTLADSIDEMLNEFKASDGDLSVSTDLGPAPTELQLWLTTELTEHPDYYIDEVYAELTSKYRPILTIEKGSMQPLYDDSYKQVLEKILDRFYEYEDAYYKEDNQ